MRNKIYKYIMGELGFGEGELLPKWCLIFRFLFFPIKTLKYLLISYNKYLHYDFVSDCLVVGGQRISISVLNKIIENANKGKIFLIYKDEGEIMINEFKEVKGEKNDTTI